MSPEPIRVDREKLSAAVVQMVAECGVVRLSEMFIKLWCGKHRPTEELEGWLRDRGLQILPSGEFQGGWKVQPAEFRLI